MWWSENVNTTHTLREVLLTSPVTLSIAGVIFIGHVLSRVLSDVLVEGLFLVPGQTLTKPWQVLSAGFFDDSLPSVLFTIPMLLYSGKRLRQAWGDRELVVFIVLVNVRFLLS